MSPTHCAIPGCGSKYNCAPKLRNLGDNECSIFAPQNVRTLLEWQKAVGNEIVLTRSSGICERHFRESDVDKFFITKLADGTTSKIRKGKGSLKLDAVPCLRLVPEQQIAEDDDSEESEYEAEYLTADCDETNEPVLSENISNDPTLTEAESQPVGSGNKRRPMSMKERLDRITLPTKAWFRDVYSDRIMWANWGDQYNTEVHVVLMKDLKLQVYLEHKQIVVPELEKIESVDEMSEKLLSAAKLLPCIGTEGAEKSPHCTGYVWRKKASQKGPQKKRCPKCRADYNYMNKRLYTLQNAIAKAKIKISKTRSSHASKTTKFDFGK